MTLRPVRGHEEIRRGLVRAHRGEALPFPLLIHGPPGVGKQRTALWIAQLLLCTEPDDAGPCGACKNCRMVLRLEHPDLHWYFPVPRPKGVSGPDRLADALEDARREALEEIRKDPLRSTHSEEPTGLYLATAQSIRSRAQKRPSMGPVQLFIVAEAETLVPQESSPEAANALLKLLEEPPEGTRMILTSNEPGRLLPTVRSRTLPLHLPRLDREVVRTFLEEEAGADPETAAWAAGLAQGSIGRALGFLPRDDEAGPLDQERRRAYRLLQSALSGRRGAAFSGALDFSPAGARALLPLFSFLEEWIRDLAAVAAGAPERVVHADAREHMEKLVAERNVDPVGAARAVDAVEDARLMASGNVNPQLIVAGLLRELRTALLREGSRAPTAGRAAHPSP